MTHLQIHNRFITRVALWILPAMALLLCFFSTHVYSDGLSDNEIKAALLLKLPQFITFQDDYFENDKSEMIICVLGDKDFMSSVKKLHKNRKIQGRRVKLINAQMGNMPTSCHVVYLDTSAGELTEKQMDHLIKSNAVTISNNDDFAARGAMVYLRLQDNKYIIEINLDVAERKNTVFNSQLLRIAKVIRDKK